MQKVAILGSGGSGKSTLARTLGQALQLPVYHLDRLFWRPGWVPTPRPEWVAIQEKLVAEERWIIDGNYEATMAIRTATADMVIFLDFPRLLCLWGAVRRRLMYAGRSRPDMGEGCPEQLDLEFLRWIWNFPREVRPKMLMKLAGLPPGTKVVRLTSRRAVAEFVRQATETCGG